MKGQRESLNFGFLIVLSLSRALGMNGCRFFLVIIYLITKTASPLRAGAKFVPSSSVLSP